MMKSVFTVLVLLTTLFACTKEEVVDCPDVITDSEANVNEFLGLWYEVASFPQFFNRGCACTTANYSLNEDGTIRVFNSCKLYGLIPNKITGYAYPIDTEDFSKLQVKFPVSPSAGDYFILAFSPNYMLVGNNKRDNLYILSRTPELDTQTYDDLISIAKDQCFDVSKLKKTKQNCSVEE